MNASKIDNHIVLAIESEEDRKFLNDMFKAVKDCWSYQNIHRPFLEKVIALTSLEQELPPPPNPAPHLPRVAQSSYRNFIQDLYEPEPERIRLNPEYLDAAYNGADQLRAYQLRAYSATLDPSPARDESPTPQPPLNPPSHFDCGNVVLSERVVSED